MSEPIKAGDTVMIVRHPRCAVCELQDGLLGLPFIAIELRTASCPVCKRPERVAVMRMNMRPTGDDCVPLDCLQRIDPPAQSETTERETELQS